MALKSEPFEVHITKWNQEVKQLGYGRSDQLGLNEVRLFYENGKFTLRAFDGTELKDIQPDFDTPIISSITSGKAIEMDQGHFILTVHDGIGNSNIKSGVDTDHKITVTDGGSHILMTHNGLIMLAVSSQLLGETFTNDKYIIIDKVNGIEMKTHQVWQAGKEKMLANNETEPTGIPWDAVGFLKLKNVGQTNQKAGAIYSIGCNMSYQQGVAMIAGSNTYYGQTQGESSVNVYIESQEVKIQNISGTAITIRYVFEGGLV